MIWRRQIWIHFLFPCKKVEGIKGRVVRLNQDTSSQSMSAVEFSATGVSVCRSFSVFRKNSLLNNFILLNVRTHTQTKKSVTEVPESQVSGLGWCPGNCLMYFSQATAMWRLVVAGHSVPCPFLHSVPNSLFQKTFPTKTFLSFASGWHQMYFLFLLDSLCAVCQLAWCFTLDAFIISLIIFLNHSPSPTPLH